MILACTETSSAEVGSSSTISLRLDRERAGDRDALLLAARQFVGIAVGEIARQLHHVEQRARRAADFCAGASLRASSGTAIDWPIERRGLSEEPGFWNTICTAALRARAVGSPAKSRPSNRIAPSLGSRQPEDHARDRRLARAALAREPEHFALARA